jgi:hypothetical protein
LSSVTLIRYPPVFVVLRKLLRSVSGSALELSSV